jgi:hypothetical protein
MASATSPDVSNPPTVRPFIHTFPGVPRRFPTLQLKTFAVESRYPPRPESFP